MKEIRNFENGTASATGRLVSGYAVRFDEVSVPIGGKFREVIAKNAFDQELVNNCKIEARLNHDPQKVLASNYEGTLELEVRDDGLFYAFEAPENEIGDELVDAIRDGKINASSFGFIVEREDIKNYSSAGENFRTVIKIKELFDVSPVYNPAYTTTSCNVRSEEAEEKTEETPIVEEVKEETIEETPKVEVKTEDVKEETTEKVEENKEEIRYNKNFIKMGNEKKQTANIMRMVYNRVNRIQQTPEDTELVTRGNQECNEASVSPTGNFQIPFKVERAISVGQDGEHVVQTDVLDLLEPLREKNVLVKAGATFYPGLKHDLQIPIMGTTNVHWEGETTKASGTTPTFSHVTLRPHRLAVVAEVTMQMLNQQTVGLEEKLEKDIINAFSAKLEDTILGSASGGTKPEGMFYGKTIVSGCSAMTDFAEIEATVEEANVFGDKKYIMSPDAKAALRALPKGGNIATSLYTNGELDGTPCLSTGHIKDSKFIYGDWSNVVIGQWGPLDIKVDDITKIDEGIVRIIANGWFDAKVLRPEAFVCGSVD